MEVEEEIMVILFGQEIRCFSMNCFDGSKEEHQIYIEVLYERSRESLNDCDVNAETSVYTICSGTVNPKPQCHIVESFSRGLLSGLSIDNFPVLWSSKAKSSSMNCVFPYFNTAAAHLQQSTESHVFESDVVDLHANIPSSLEAFSAKELTVWLRSYALHFLEDADWKVQVRKRRSPWNDGRGKKKLDYYFISPEGTMLHSLPKAWVACGSMLLSSTKNARADDESERVWVDVAEFWSELESILVYVDKKFQDLERSASLLHRWRILDPFVAVLCISMKLGALNRGMVVKAVRSEAIILSEDKRLYLALKGVDKLHGHSFHGKLSHTVQPHFPNSRLQVIECSRGRQVSHLNDSKNLKRKVRNLELINRDMATVGSSMHDFMYLRENSSIQSNSIYSSPIDRSSKFDFFSPPDKFITENDSFKESRVDKQAHSNDTPCSSMIAVNYKEKLGLHDALGDSIRSLSFQGTHEFGDGSLFKHIDSSYNSHWRAEEAAEVREQNMVDFENTGNIFTVNLPHEHPVDGQGVLLFYPQQKTVCVNQDGYCREELVGHFVSPCDVGSGMKQEIESYYCQSSNLDIAQPFNSSNNSSHDTVFPFEEDIIGSVKKRGRWTDSHLVPHVINALDNKSCRKFLAARRSSQASRNPVRIERSYRFLAHPARREEKTIVDVKKAQKGARTVLCWLIKMGMISFYDIIQYQTSRSNYVVKEGRITKAGILCKCCKEVFSVSGFKRHAGCKLQKPSLNLFLKSGKPYISCQLQAWSAEYKLRKDSVQTKKVEDEDKNDDICSFFANGGELICCDSCPSTYHQTCLYLQELPEGSWHCPNCSCAFCGYVLNVAEDSDSIATMECSQCERRYHEMCIKEKVRCDAVGSNMWFCGQKCLQVYTGLHSLVGVMNCAKDGFSWTVLKCNHVEKFHSSRKTALIAECNTKLAISLSIMEESFLPMLDPRTGNNMFPQFLYNLGMNTAPANSQGFFTVALEKDDELFSIATIRVHGVTLAEMPLIATCIEQRRKGMCRRLMHVIEEVFQAVTIVYQLFLCLFYQIFSMSVCLSLRFFFAGLRPKHVLLVKLLLVRRCLCDLDFGNKKIVVFVMYYSVKVLLK